MAADVSDRRNEIEQHLAASCQVALAACAVSVQLAGSLKRHAFRLKNVFINELTRSGARVRPHCPARFATVSPAIPSLLPCPRPKYEIEREHTPGAIPVGASGQT